MGAIRRSATVEVVPIAPRLRDAPIREALDNLDGRCGGQDRSIYVGATEVRLGGVVSARSGRQEQKLALGEAHDPPAVIQLLL